jgi:hypothetical protein
MNLKKVLMELGNQLVQDHQFTPANIVWDETGEPTTTPIQKFTDFLNNCPEAQAILKEMDIEWPVA